MKKFLLIAATAFVLGACSADNDEILIDKDNTQSVALAAPENEKVSMSIPQKNTRFCFSSFGARASVDVSGGFGNPVVLFTAVVPNNILPTAKYRVRVEVQPLEDCDDMDSHLGNAIVFSAFTIFTNISSSAPKVSVLPASLPQCYKWRMIADGYETQKNPVCTSISSWYEAPLF